MCDCQDGGPPILIIKPNKLGVFHLKRKSQVINFDSYLVSLVELHTYSLSIHRCHTSSLRCAPRPTKIFLSSVMIRIVSWEYFKYPRNKTALKKFFIVYKQFFAKRIRRKKRKIKEIDFYFSFF